MQAKKVPTLEIGDKGINAKSYTQCRLWSIGAQRDKCEIIRTVQTMDHELKATVATMSLLGLVRKSSWRDLRAAPTQSWRRVCQALPADYYNLLQSRKKRAKGEGCFFVFVCLTTPDQSCHSGHPLPLRMLSRTYTMGLRVTAEETHRPDAASPLGPS